MACKYQLEGQDNWMSESELKKMLNEGLLDKLMIDNDIKIRGLKPVESLAKSFGKPAVTETETAKKAKEPSFKMPEEKPAVAKENVEDFDAKEYRPARAIYRGNDLEGYSIKLNPNGRTVDIKLPTGKEIKNRKIDTIDDGFNPPYKSIDAGEGVRLRLAPPVRVQVEEEVKVEKTGEKKNIRRKPIEGRDKLQNKEAIELAEELKFSPNEFDGTEAVKDVPGLMSFNEKVEINGRTYGNDKMQATFRYIDTLLDSKRITEEEAEILNNAYEAKKAAYFKAEEDARNKKVEKFREKVSEALDPLRAKKGRMKSTLNPFDFIPDNIRNKVIDKTVDLITKGYSVSLSFKQAVLEVLTDEILSNRMTEKEGFEIEAKIEENIPKAERMLNAMQPPTAAPQGAKTQKKYNTPEARAIFDKAQRNPTWEELKALAVEAVEKGIVEPKAIINDILNNDRNLLLEPLNAVEKAALDWYANELNKNNAALNNELADDIKDNNGRKYTDIKSRIADNNNEIIRFAEAAVFMQNSAGYLFGLNKESFGDGYSISDVFAKLRAVMLNNPDGVPQDVLDKFAKMVNEKDAKVAELDALEEKLKKAREEDAMQNIVDDVNDNGVSPETTSKKKTFGDVARGFASNIRKNKVHRPGIFMAATPASLAFDLAIEAAAKAAETSAALSDAVNAALTAMKNTGWFGALSDSDKALAEKELRNYLAENASTVSMSADGKLKVPTALIRRLVSEGNDNIDSLVQAVRNELAITNPDVNLDDRQIRDAITNYGEMVRMPKSDLTKIIADIKSIGRKISKLEDLRAQKIKTRNPRKIKELTEREVALNIAINKMLNLIPLSQEQEQDLEISRLNALKNRRLAKIAELREHIAANKRAAKQTKIPVTEDAESLRLQAEIDSLQEQIDQIPLTDQEIQAREAKKLENYKKRQRAALLAYQQKLDNRDFSKKKPKSLELDEEAKDLRREVQNLRDQIQIEVDKIEQANRNIGLKVAEGILSVVNSLKGLIMSVDLSVFRQAGMMLGYILVTDPKRVVSFVGNVFRLAGLVPSRDAVKNPKKWGQDIANSLLDEDRGKKLYEQFQAERKLSADYELMQKSKLFFQEDTPSLVAKTDEFSSDLLRKIPLIGKPMKIGGVNILGLDLVGRGERSFSALNELREHMFMAGANKLIDAGKTFESHPEEFRRLARWVNTLSGRGVGGEHKAGRAFETLSPYLNLPFVSARFLKSRLEFSLLNPVMYYKWAMMPREVKLMAAGQIVAANAYMAGTTALIATLLMGFGGGGDDEDDGWKMSFNPSSSSFLKLRKGNTSVDLMQGFQQTNVLIYREITGLWSDSEGVEKEMNTEYNGPTRGNTIGRFAMSKMNNWVQFLINQSMKVEKKEEEGVTDLKEKEEVDPNAIPIWKYFTPLSIQTAVELDQQEDLSTTEKVILNLASFTGFANVSVTPKKVKKSKTRVIKDDIFGGGSQDPFSGSSSNPF